MSFAPRAFAVDASDWHAYTDDLRARHVPVFLASCAIAPGHIAILTFPLGSQKGAFFEVQTGPDGDTRTLNFAEMVFDQGQLRQPQLAFGGSYTLNSLDHTIRFLLTSRFSMKPPETLSVPTGDASPPCPPLPNG